jgi:hypothetical protein
MDTRENMAGAEPMISALSDAELLANTRGLTGRSNQLLAALLAHLGEVDARALYRQRACSSLFAYCVYELRLSEDEAVRRVTAARLTRKFPELLDAVAAGELHLTGLLLLGPHLTRENFREVMARAKHRSKKRSRSWSASSIRCRTFQHASRLSDPCTRAPHGTRPGPNRSRHSPRFASSLRAIGQEIGSLQTLRKSYPRRRVRWSRSATRCSSARPRSTST